MNPFAPFAPFSDEQDEREYAIRFADGSYALYCGEPNCYTRREALALIDDNNWDATVENIA